MKVTYTDDLLRMSEPGAKIKLAGWISSKRKQGKVIFLDIRDSRGVVQAVITEDNVGSEKFDLAKQFTLEAAVIVEGFLSITSREQREITVKNITLIGGVVKQFSPQPRSVIDIFDPKHAPYLLKHRHIYLRNPKVMAVLQFRDLLMHHMRQWFYDNKFTSIDAPILTPVPLYEDDTAMMIEIDGEKVFLTQCVGYYLEAAVHAFERVFNIGPSFRGEESRSKRHLMEYWHIKAEVAWADLDDIIGVVESIISTLIQKCSRDAESLVLTIGTKFCTDGLKVPFQRISYEESLKLLNEKGIKIEFGENLGSEEEAELSKLFDGPFWVTGIPKVIEPFPYVVDKDDPRITRVADLIASNGYGELLGTAEKICDLGMLEERMKDKGKGDDVRYEFVRDVHKVGCVPHAAFGMGVERLIRWMLNIPHVRDAIPFPRIFRRKISP